MRWIVSVPSPTVHRTTDGHFVIYHIGADMAKGWAHKTETCDFDFSHSYAPVTPVRRRLSANEAEVSDWLDFAEHAMAAADVEEVPADELMATVEVEKADFYGGVGEHSATATHVEEQSVSKMEQATMALSAEVEKGSLGGERSDEYDFTPTRTEELYESNLAAHEIAVPTLAQTEKGKPRPKDLTHEWRNSKGGSVDFVRGQVCVCSRQATHLQFPRLSSCRERILN